MPTLSLIGTAQAILKNLNAVAKTNDPQLKLTPVGFLQMLLENNAAGMEITNVDELRKGQNATVKVRYMQRGIESDASTTDDCDTTISPSWNETTIGHGKFAKIGIKIDDDDMRLLTSDAAAGNDGMTKAMQEVIYTKINGLLQKINTILVTEMASSFGKNIAYSGTAAGAAQTIYFGEKMKMNNGLVKLRSDMSMNEVIGDVILCGNGHIVNYDTYIRANGGASPLKVYEDFKTVSSWGANAFGAFEKNSVGFVDWQKNVGSYAGQKGTSVFFTLPMPLTLANGQTVTMVFDCQLKYVDCPTYSDGTRTSDRGWVLEVCKSFGLFTIPNNCYSASDRLNGVRGTFLYTAAEAVETYNVATAAGTALAVAPGTGANFAATVAPAEGAVFHTQEEAADDNAGGGSVE